MVDGHAADDERDAVAELVRIHTETDPQVAHGPTRSKLRADAPPGPVQARSSDSGRSPRRARRRRRGPGARSRHVRVAYPVDPAPAPDRERRAPLTREPRLPRLEVDPREHLTGAGRSAEHVGPGLHLGRASEKARLIPDHALPACEVQTCLRIHPNIALGRAEAGLARVDAEAGDRRGRKTSRFGSTEAADADATRTTARKAMMQAARTVLSMPNAARAWASRGRGEGGRRGRTPSPVDPSPGSSSSAAVTSASDSIAMAPSGVSWSRPQGRRRRWIATRPARRAGRTSLSARSPT